MEDEKETACAAAVGAAATVSTTSWAADPSTLRVVAVQTNDLAAYTKALGVIGSIEYPGPTAALVGAKMGTLGSIRKVISDSLYRELKL